MAVLSHKSNKTNKQGKKPKLFLFTSEYAEYKEMIKK